ncbi:MAG: universal stress protein [Chloroflexota bacterium]
MNSTSEDGATPCPNEVADTQLEPTTTRGVPATSPFRRLLVPLDGSPMAESALPIATRIADACGAAMTLLHIVERGAPAQVHGERHLKGAGEADEYLAEVARGLARAGRPIEQHTHEVPVGNVAESIAAHADEYNTDLIVLCTHGAGGVREAIWGSIAQQVLQRTTLPILLTRASGLGSAPFEPRTIMVPLDATAAAEAAIGPALGLARCLGAAMRLVVVVATPDTVASPQRPTATLLPTVTRELLDVQEKQAVAYLDRLAGEIRATGIEASGEVRRGDAVTELATDTGEHADGLVVVATHGRAGLQAIWSPSVAARLLTRTHAPVLLVRIVDAD